MAAKLSTHVLDLANGCPASGMTIELWLLHDDQRTLITTTTTNADGRTDAPLLASEAMQPGLYEILFFVGDYFAGRSPGQPEVRFLDKVPIRFRLADPKGSYHVPLLCSPWAYSTYRGS